MKRIIKANNNNVPIILQGSAIKEIKLTESTYSRLTSDTQFPIDKITELNGDYYHGYNARLRKFWFGQGILWDVTYNRIVAIFLEGQRVAVLNNWAWSYYNEFTRFKKALREAGYNTRNHKCIYFVDNFSDFFLDILAPKFEDYSEDYQRTVSREFMELERAAVNISE